MYSIIKQATLGNAGVSHQYLQEEVREIVTINEAGQNRDNIILRYKIFQSIFGRWLNELDEIDAGNSQ